MYRPRQPRYWLSLLLVSAALLLLGCRGMENYANAQGPRFFGNYADEAAVLSDQHDAAPDPIKVVTWNIKFSREIDQAIVELTTTPELSDADILLLQEMDEEGVDKIARTLAMNYVYYPASIHSEHGRNFGNAVLSPWPLSDDAKVALPHRNPTNGQARIAVRATATIGSQAVVAYSVHTETFWLLPQRRADQMAKILADANRVVADAEAPTIVGGDFNTLTAQSADSLDEQFNAAGFSLVSPASETTMHSRGLDFSVDYIYGRDLVGLDSGVWSQTTASDHNPVWAILSLP